MIINDFNRIFPTTFPQEIPQKYNEYCEHINRCIFENGYNRIVNPRYNNDNLLLKTCEWCSRNAWNITRILDTISLEYNPIHNYDGTEKVTIERNAYNDTTSTDAMKTTLDIDAVQDKTTTGAQKTVVEDDAVTDKTVNDAMKTETTNKINAFNGDDFTNNDKSTTNTDSYNVELQKGATKETTNVDGYDVTLNNGARKETTNVDSYDVTLKKGAQKETTTIEKGGNLGVTTTQQMLTSEFDMLSGFNQITIITNMWFDAFTIGFSD